MALDTRGAVMQWAPSYKRATWMQAPLAIVSFLAGVSAWLLGGGVLWLIAALLVGSVVPITFILIMPTNHQLLAAERDLGSEETRRHDVEAVDRLSGSTGGRGQVISVPAFAGAFKDIGPRFESATGHKLVVNFAILVRRIDSGEKFDVAPIRAQEIDSLIGRGRVASDSRVDIARVGIGVWRLDTPRCP